MRPDPRRRALVVAAPLLAVAVRVSSQPARMPRIGLLVAETQAGQASRIDALRAGLRDHGYVEGTTLAIEIVTADGDYDRLPALAAELVKRRVDVIVAFGIKALVAAREATATAPIVIPSTSSDPVAMGLVDTLSRQESNITGSLAVGPAIMAKRLELLKEAVPSLARVVLLVNPANTSLEPMATALERSVRALRLTLRRVPVDTPDRIEPLIEGAGKGPATAIVVQDDTLFAVHARAIAAHATRRGLPSAGGTAFADAGGLLGYGAADLALYRRGAYFVDRILKGAKPRDLPFEQATRFDLVVNARTAQALGLALPQSLLLRADRVLAR